MSLTFPENFLWGSATSAYQVEGGVEGSDWSRVFPAGRACDHYSRYEEDFDLLQKLNQNAYRFSIEWSRVEPDEKKFDEREIEHYRQVLLSLRRRGIKAMVILHHFTNPLWLAKIGGWANSKTVFYFFRFAERMFKEYGDLVDFWITINEPMIYAGKGYLEGSWPPQKRNPVLFLKVLRNQIAAHKKVYEKAHDREIIQVGIAKNNQYFEPANNKSPLDRFFVFLADYFWNRWFLNRIKNHLDFIGLNYYFHNKIGFPLPFRSLGGGGTYRMKNENRVVSDIGWEVYPQGIYHVLKELKDYKKPIYITENGVADAKDALRKDFIGDHLLWTHKAISEGVDVRGYFYWSLMDNFEWEKGFKPRFGLVEIDYETLARRPRPSAWYYGEICKKNMLK